MNASTAKIHNYVCPRCKRGGIMPSEDEVILMGRCAEAG